MWWGGRNEEAESALREADVRLSKLQNERPDDVRFRSSLPGALINLGMIMGWTKRHDEDEKVTGRAVKLLEGLVQDFPDVPNYQDSLATALSNLANAEQKQGRSLESEKHHRIALGVSERLADRHPDVPVYEESFGRISKNLVLQLTEQEKYGEARQVFERALSRAKKALKGNPGQQLLIVNLVNCSTGLASTWLDLGDHARAAQAIEDLPSLSKSLIFSRINPTEEAHAKFFVGHILMSCARLAERESTLSPAERKKALRTYTDQASVWIKEATRAAEDWARNELKDSKTPGTKVAAQGENRIREVEQDEHRADLSANRRESAKLEEFLLVKALTKEAIARAPDDPSQYQIADLLTSAPEGLRDPELALKLARRAVELKPGDGMRAQSLGWALYRAGDWKGSLELIQKQAKNLESHFVLAMAYWQLGEKTEAKARFDRANEWLKGYEQRCEQDLKQGAAVYPPPSLLKRFQAEAAALLGVPDTPPAEKEKTGKGK
jgi:tetratricopeptide (TPR) repeat protein